MLFLIFINDIAEGIDSSVRLFADDCLVYRPIRSKADHAQLQRDLDQITSWADQWQMEFNVSKCRIMTISLGRRREERVYTMKAKVVTHSNTNPYLGVTFSSDMRWTAHVNNISAKANRMLGFLKRNLRDCRRDVKEKAHLTLVRPRMEYASAIWSPHQDYNRRKLEQIQKRAARFVTNTPITKETRTSVSTTKLVRDLGWDTLETRRKRSAATLLYKVTNGLVVIPPDYHPTPPARTTRRCHNSRSFQLPQPRVDAFKHSFFPRTIPIWNRLPDDVVTAEDLEVFKAKVQQASLQ